jgi:murein DD-endopeptidase MepM/ murein hydrolase activator NlpD
MATTLWTAAVRGIAVLTAALAVGVIVVSLQAARAQAGPPASTRDGIASASANASALDRSEAETGAPAPSGDVLDPSESLEPVQAMAQATPGPAVQQAAPPMRYPAPSDALPATRARSVLGSASASARPKSVPTSDRPLAAVLDVGASASPDVMELALLTKQGLESRGYEVSLLEGAADPDSGPLRPDAYVSIRSVAGAEGGAGVEAWFCQVEGSLSGQLADLLLKGLVTAGPRNVGEGDGAITDPETFRCGELLAGRARMPAVLLEVPDLTAGGGNSQAMAQSLASGIDQFFQRNRATLLREDQRQRLVWPALGPITSYFGPSHPLGIDIGQSEGPVVAATDGMVLFAGGDPCCSYGLYVVVVSPDGITTVYAHLESIAVTQGQKVRQGQALGEVGCTGHCYGTHLHFEVIEGGTRRNPISYLP